jgi:hypothetical protein
MYVFARTCAGIRTTMKERQVGAEMIASRLPPSRFRGSVAASIHTASFNCFISTVKGFFFSRRWQTLIVNGDPGVDKECKAIVAFFIGIALIRQRSIRPTIS